MGLFKYATGGYKFEYSKIISKHFNEICREADEREINLFDYSRTSNFLSHQEMSVVLFLMNIAILEESKGKENIVHTQQLKLDTVTKVLKKILNDRGFRSSDISTFINSSKIPKMARTMSQALFGRDYYRAINYKSLNADTVLLAFLDSLVNDWCYQDKIDDKSPDYSIHNKRLIYQTTLLDEIFDKDKESINHMSLRKNQGKKSIAKQLNEQDVESNFTFQTIAIAFFFLVLLIAIFTN